MKKIIAFLLVALMSISCLAACGNGGDNTENAGNSGLEAALKYVHALYKDKPTVTAVDFDRTAQVMIDGVAYKVEWTTNTDKVKVVVNDKIATIDVDEESPEQVDYVLTATVSDAEGNKLSKEYNYTVPKFEGYKTILDAAYALASGETLDGTFTLAGVITAVTTPYDSGYNNVTVIIQVGDYVDMPIMCYRLKDGAEAGIAEKLKVGDTITVTGTLKNYNGTIEFDAGCTIDAYEAGEGEQPVAPEVPAGATMDEIVDIAYTIPNGLKLETAVTLTGVITAVDTAFNPDYGNVSVTIQVGDKADKLILCYRLKGDGADTIKVGDTITVTGYIKNYNGTIEFDAGCTLDAVTAGEGGNTEVGGNTGNENTGNENTGNENTGNENTGNENTGNEGNTETTMTQEDIVNAAYALASGAAMEGKYTLTGVITKVKTYYDAAYKNVTVIIQVGDMTDKLIECYRLKGEGADQLHPGDTITVTGVLKNYNGTIEFDSGCTLDNLVNVEGLTNVTVPEGATPSQIYDLASGLKDGECLVGTYTITGVVTEIVTEYSEQYKNVTFTITADGKVFECYRLKGDGAESVKVGDTVTVKGTIINYKGEKVEFTAGCTLE